MHWLLEYPSRALAQLEAFFMWRHWWVVIAVIAATTFIVGFTFKRAVTSPRRWAWMSFGIASCIPGLIAYIAVYNEVGATPPGMLSGVSLLSGAKGVSVAAGVPFGEALREWRQWMKQNREMM
jgi:hypothetical protein